MPQPTARAWLVHAGNQSRNCTNLTNASNHSNATRNCTTLPPLPPKPVTFNVQLNLLLASTTWEPNDYLEIWARRSPSSPIA